METTTKPINEAPPPPLSALSSDDNNNNNSIKFHVAGNKSLIPHASIRVRPEKILDLAQNINTTDTATTTTTTFPCHLCDKHLLDVIAQELLSGLATACIDSTRGNPFKSPSSVANDIRKAMLKYLGTRSQYFVAESTFIEGAAGPAHANSGDHDENDPYDIISGFLDDFAHLNRNLFSMVPGWLLSEKRMTRIDVFLKELKEKDFWELEMREAVAQVLLMNVDFMNLFHCTVTLDSEEELEQHQRECGFRPVMCGNEGCEDKFSADHLEHHDLMCPFKVVHCELGCAAQVLRHEMEGHCKMVCPMKEAAINTATGGGAAAAVTPADLNLVHVETSAPSVVVDRLHNNTTTTSLMDPVSPPPPSLQQQQQPAVVVAAPPTYTPPSPDQTAVGATAGFPADLSSSSVTTTPPSQRAPDEQAIAVFSPDQSVAAVSPPSVAVLPPAAQSVSVLPPPAQSVEVLSPPALSSKTLPEEAPATIPTTQAQPQQVAAATIVDPPQQATTALSTTPSEQAATASTTVPSDQAATASTTVPLDQAATASTTVPLDQATTLSTVPLDQATTLSTVPSNQATTLSTVPLDQPTAALSPLPGKDAAAELNKAAASSPAAGSQRES